MLIARVAFRPVLGADAGPLVQTGAARVWALGETTTSEPPKLGIHLKPRAAWPSAEPLSTVNDVKVAAPTLPVTR